jgi:DNA repair exonuclease SbcCD ATPase subunit
VDTTAEPEIEPSPGGLELVHAPASAVTAEIERIRASVHHWIDQIEHGLRDRPGDPVADRERQLAQEQEELEHNRQVLQGEIERRAHEWEALLEALERDRQLLADAWERLESEQLAVAGSSRAAAHAVTVDSSPVSRADAPRSPTETDTAVSRAILRQFEALRQDVRTQAGTRRGV